MIPLGRIAIQGFKSLRDTAFELGLVTFVAVGPQACPALLRRAATRDGGSTPVRGAAAASRLRARPAAAAVAGGCWTE